MIPPSVSRNPDANTGVVQRVSIEFPGTGEEQARGIELELGRGHIYHAIGGSTRSRQAAMEQLVDSGIAAVVPADGGLIGNLKVWENLVLPAAYHGHARTPELETRATRLFGEFGISGGPFERLCTEAPDHLNRFERRLCAFVRAMLLEPQIMAYDSVFDGLSREQTRKVLLFDALFHDRFPLGTSLHLTDDLPTLPELGAHHTFHL